MKRLLEGGQFILFYLLHLGLGTILQVLKKAGRIKISYQEKIPYHQGNLILVANHPTLLEPVITNFAFFTRYVFHPRLVPWNTPDRKNFYEPRWCWCFRSRSVPIDRQQGQISLSRQSVRKIKEILQARQVLILFPEGGRTFKGKELVFSRAGKRIRKLKEGAAWLVKQTGAAVVPMWIDGSETVLPNGKFPFPRFWKGKIVVKIGHPLSFPDDVSRQGITQTITLALLELADK